MTQSDYIRHSIMNNSIEVIDRSRSLYIALRKIGDSIDKEEQHLPKPDFDVIREEVLQLAHKIADAYGENYITAYAVHLDTRNIHVHLAIDTISWRDGHRFSVSHELKWLRAIIEGWQKEMDDTIRTNQSFDRNLRYYGEY